MGRGPTGDEQGLGLDGGLARARRTSDDFLNLGSVVTSAVLGCSLS